MPYDIYGNNLQKGYCEVHPWTPEEYPCYLCRNEIDAEHKRQQQLKDETKIMNQQAEQHYLNEETKQLLQEIVSEFSEYKKLAQGTSKCEAIIKAENLLEKLP